MKEHEIAFPTKLSPAEQAWLRSKPFGTFDRAESQRNLADVATFLALLARHAPDAERIVELGCGPGWLSLFLAQLGYTVTGFDLSPQMIAVAKEKAKQAGVAVTFVVADMEAPIALEPADRVDVVLIYDALHHCQADEPALRSAAQRLRPGGVLILAEPNRAHASDPAAVAATKRFGVTERGLDAAALARSCRQVGFAQVWRYHASGQAFQPRHEGLLETVRMLTYPVLARFIFGAFQTRIWLVAQQPGGGA
ncbi:class I SAM-dependent methyltransferase [Candidatus Berkelbacteria bacterium]|nr:class I SAM-dependent methyltransferase [Candidatus Berkelbacteria bacterium]